MKDEQKRSRRLEGEKSVPERRKHLAQKLTRLCQVRELQVLPPAWKVEGKGEEWEEGAGRVADNARGETGGRLGSLNLILKIT